MPTSPASVARQLLCAGAVNGNTYTLASSTRNDHPRLLILDQADAQLAGDFLERARHVEGVVLAFHGAGPGDQGQGLRIADGQQRNLAPLGGEGEPPPLRLSAEGAVKGRFALGA